MLESLSTYYPDEHETLDEGELILGRYTDEQWEQMTPNDIGEAYAVYWKEAGLDELLCRD